jgi:hypothetical protein
VQQPAQRLRGLFIFAAAVPRKMPKGPLNECQIQENHPSGALARVDYADFSGTAEAVPFQSRTYSELP